MRIPERARKQTSGATVVTQRDVNQLLAFIAQAQPVSTGHVRRHSGMSLAMTRRRLRVLRDHGLVRVWVPQMAGSNFYGLTAAGRTLLAETGIVERSQLYVMRHKRLPTHHLAHHLMGLDVALALQEAASALPMIEIQDVVFERELRRRLGRPKGAQIPDVVVVFRDGYGQDHALALEVDRGTEDVRWFAENKGLSYLNLLQAEVPLLGSMSWSIGVVVPDDSRSLSLIEALWNLGVPEGLFYFAPIAALTVERSLTNAWITARVIGRDAELVRESPLAGLTGRSFKGDLTHELGENGPAI